MTTTTVFDLESYSTICALGVFIKHLGEALGPMGERIDSEPFQQLIRDRWGEDYEDSPEFWKAEARSHERFAVLMRELAEDLKDDAEKYEGLAKTEWERARTIEQAS
jgi:hypothetical protein